MSHPDRTFPTLNAVRGIGALMVLTTHAAFNTGQILRGWPGGVLARLDFGVPLFFVLSGFLLRGPSSWHRPRRAPSVAPPLPVEAGAADPAALLAGRVRRPAVRPGEPGTGLGVWVRQLTLTQLYFPHCSPSR